MNLKIYTYLFFNNILKSTIIPIKTVNAFKTILIFDNQNYYAIIIIAIIGSALGDIINLLLGFFIKQLSPHINTQTIKYQEIITKYSIILLLFTPLFPKFGKTIILFFGYLNNKKIKPASVLILLSYIIYYCTIGVKFKLALR